MKSYFNNILVKNWATNILISLALLFIIGCDVTISSPSRFLEIKPFEEVMAEKYKKIKNARELTLETEISSQIIISPGTPNYFVEYLKANLKILPVIDTRQKVLDLEIIPTGKVDNRSLEYELDYPSPGIYEFRLEFKAELKHEFVQVTEKIPFPLHVIPEEQIKYAKPSLMIDSDNDEIRALASVIAQGEDDLYRVVFKASKWVRENVQGQIDNSIISTSQKASWVLKNRKGVCDEKSNLFIGILRSLGIPAKFITGFVGISYNGTITFKPHGWTEVYFPSAGWVPFDVAYNQLGFIDAAHIKLTESVDISDSFTSYEWKSVDISDSPTSTESGSDNTLVSIKDLEIRTKVKQITGTVTPLLVIKPKVWYRNIDIESYNVIEATVINPNKFYVITDIYLKIPVELKTMEKINKMILMEPDTKKTIYWIVKPSIEITSRKIAIFPINVVFSGNTSSGTEFSVAKAQGYTKHSFEKLKNAVKRKILR